MHFRGKLHPEFLHIFIGNLHTEICQVGGIASETSATDSAIKATRGQIITYANEPICAVFHAASGGFTENSEDVWSVTVPYLRSVDDSTEQSPYTDWSTQIKIDDLSKTLARQYTNIGTIKEIDTTNFPQGVKKNSKTKVIKFTGSNKKTLELTGTQLRSLLGLKSNNFSLSLIQDKKKLKDSKKLNQGTFQGEYPFSIVRCHAPKLYVRGPENIHGASGKKRALPESAGRPRHQGKAEEAYPRKNPAPAVLGQV